MSVIALAQPNFEWHVQPAAAAWVEQQVTQFCQRNGFAARLAQQLQTETATRLHDWVDTICLPADRVSTTELRSLGFELRSESTESQLWAHPHGLFPMLDVCPGPEVELLVKVDSVCDFLTAQQFDDRLPIIGSAWAAVRLARIAEEDGTVFNVVERHGAQTLHVAENYLGQAQMALRHLEAFRLRQRQFARPAEGFAHAEMLIDLATSELGRDYACDLFFQAEREYWQRRNRAAQVQKARQDKLGMGWANHDHHTYRCSREHFASLIRVLEKLGFECRERFFAGRAAGWGAQVLEQPAAGVVIFADVDLAAEEVSGDFAHEPLPTRQQLGTVGLWCRLHGEAFLEAGMHHLECRFDFQAAQAQLAKEGVTSMKPFTDFDFLKQCFTQGEVWQVAPDKLAAALAAGVITAEQAEHFRTHGALGSHLELLQRDQGYKGFNQTGISEIIQATDPRNAKNSNH